MGDLGGDSANVEIMHVDEPKFYCRYSTYAQVANEDLAKWYTSTLK